MKNARITIRDARIQDAELIAWTLMSAIGMESEDPSKAIAAACNPDTLYCWKRSRILEVNGKPAGCLISYPGKEYDELRFSTWKEIWGDFEDKEGYQKQYEPETADGEYYLDCLAVKPGFRGQGLGKLLIQDGIEMGQKLGIDRITLVAESASKALCAYYREIGFREERTLPFFGHEYIKMVFSGTLG